MSQHEPTTPIQTHLDESDDPQRRAPGVPSDPDSDPTDTGRADTGRADTGRAAPHHGSTAVPEFRSGPAPTTTLVGLLGLLATITILVTQATDLDIPWGVVGPVAVVGAGVLLVVLGLAGLRGQRFRG